ncbi:IS3 family transposase [Geobacter sp. SVR]|uniref:IS3 family transposase n=1 Tax=Geobacter sp. SVR TaxID=2495594 RepID=UPI00143F0474|nr:IS3 family transposase [Geobacter sp. SVR]BCS54417.1 hypothetical protein GSVR_27250 [Geobacter sp. SVR]GCF87648.1 hypothetical protein GSbR_42480 [Geobacter sp. SVR]
MCRVFGVSRSRYYTQLNAKATKRRREDRALLVDIKAAFDDSDQTYGAGRIGHELRARGTRVGKNRIWRLMKLHGLRVKTMRRFKLTTNSDHKRPVAPNLVKRNFSAEAPVGSGPEISPTSGPPKAGCILPSFWMSFPAGLLAGAWTRG